MPTLGAASDELPYMAREVPPKKRTSRPIHNLVMGKDGVVHIEVEKVLEPDEPQYDVFMRSGTMVRMTKTEFTEFEQKYNPSVTPEEKLMKVFVGTEYAPTEGE